MNNHYICETILETNIADTIYRYMEREDDTDEWVEDFRKVLYAFDKAHETDSDIYEFEFDLNDRTGNIEFQAWFKRTSVNEVVPTITNEVKLEIEDMVQYLIEQLNNYLAKNRLCQIPKDTDLLYHNGKFYVPVYKSETYFHGTEPIYIKDDFYATDIEWYEDDY